MNVTPQLIRAWVDRYATQPEVVESLRNSAMDQMADGGRVITASSGAGTGYTVQMTGSPGELVEFFQTVLDEIHGIEAKAAAGSLPIIFPGTAC